MQCEMSGCIKHAVFHLSWFQTRQCQREQHLCEEHTESVFLNLGVSKPVGNEKSAFAEQARCFGIELIIISEVNDQQVVYLREVGGERTVPILIGIFEATALDRNLKRIRSPRPLTHDAMLRAIRALNGEIESALIADLKDHVYYTSLRIRQNDQTVSVDVRPSDAFNLAVLADVPIFISDQVLAVIGPVDR